MENGIGVSHSNKKSRKGKRTEYNKWQQQHNNNNIVDMNRVILFVSVQTTRAKKKYIVINRDFD